MVFVVRREVNVLTKIERGKKRQKLKGESVCRIIEMNVEVTDVLMLSIQAVRGLPRLRAPGIVPCIISFSRQLPCFLMV